MLYITSITLRTKTGSSSKTNAMDFFHRARINISPAGETVMENWLEGTRYTRPHKLYRAEVLPQLFRLLGLNDVQVSWSQKAGCRCGCSPGFIVKTDNVAYDIYVDVTDKYTRSVKISGQLGIVSPAKRTIGH